MHFAPDFTSRFRILKGGKISLVVSALLAGSSITFASPSGGNVTSGSATINQTGGVTTINQSSNKASINWQSFNIAPSETVNFVQPSASSVTLNRVVGTSQSLIQGAMNANGQVILVNPNGVVFTQGSSVNVAGLIATTKNITDENFQAGNYLFEGDSQAAILNMGTISAQNGGYVAMMGKSVQNQGTITADQGRVELAGGSKFTLNLNGNSLLSLQIDEGTINALVENGGLIKSDGGVVHLTTKALDSILDGMVNNTGVIEAQSLDSQNGEIILFAHGGTANIGGVLKAEGGFVETSGKEFAISEGATIQAGHWLIDPVNVVIDSTLAGTIQTALGTGDVTITTQGNNTPSTTSGESGSDGDIFVNSSITWNAHKLLLEAEGNIYIQALLTAGGTSTLDLKTGYDGSTYSGNKYVLMGFNQDGSFAGRVDFTSASDPTGYRSGQNILTINGDNYYLINALGNDGSTTGTDLQGIQGNLSGKFALAGNIDASSTSSWNGGKGFMAIGMGVQQFCCYSAYVNGSFTGIFNGLGHTINGLTTSDTDGYSDFSGLYTGLFSKLDGALVSNVGMTNLNMESYGITDGTVGAIAGEAIGNSKILSVYSTGLIKGSSYGASMNTVNNYGGGLIGNLGGGSRLSYSYSTATIDGGRNVGALVGVIDVGGGELSDNFANSVLSGQHNGLIGLHIYDAVVKNNFIIGYELNGGLFAGQGTHYSDNFSTSSGDVQILKTINELKEFATYSGGWNIHGDNTLQKNYPFIRFTSSGLSWVIGTASASSGGGSSSGSIENTTTEQTVNNVVTNIVNNAINNSIPSNITQPQGQTPSGFERRVESSLVSVGSDKTLGTVGGGLNTIIRSVEPSVDTVAKDTKVTLVGETGGEGEIARVELDQIMAKSGGGELRVALSPNSFIELVNGGVTLPNGVSQEFYVVADKE